MTLNQSCSSTQSELVQSFPYNHCSMLDLTTKNVARSCSEVSLRTKVVALSYGVFSPHKSRTSSFHRSVRARIAYVSEAMPVHNTIQASTSRVETPAIALGRDIIASSGMMQTQQASVQEQDLDATPLLLESSGIERNRCYGKTFYVQQQIDRRQQLFIGCGIYSEHGSIITGEVEYLLRTRIVLGLLPFKEGVHDVSVRTFMKAFYQQSRSALCKALKSPETGLEGAYVQYDQKTQLLSFFGGSCFRSCVVREGTILPSTERQDIHGVSWQLMHPIGTGRTQVFFYQEDLDVQQILDGALSKDPFSRFKMMSKAFFYVDIPPIETVYAPLKSSYLPSHLTQAPNGEIIYNTQHRRVPRSDDGLASIFVPENGSDRLRNTPHGSVEDKFFKDEDIVSSEVVLDSRMDALHTCYELLKERGEEEERIVVQQTQPKGCGYAAMAMLIWPYMNEDQRREKGIFYAGKGGLIRDESIVREINTIFMQLSLAKEAVMASFSDWSDIVRIISLYGSIALSVNGELGGHILVLDALDLSERTATIREPYHGMAVTVHIRSVDRMVQERLDVIYIKEKDEKKVYEVR